MSLLRRFYDLFFEKASAAIDAASDPEEKIRLALHELEETGPTIRAALAGPIAEETRLQKRVSENSNRVQELTGKVQAAVNAGNTEVARIRGGQLLDAQKEQSRLEGLLATAKDKANEARERFEDWKRKTSELQSKALESLDVNRRAEAQEQFNQVMVKLDTTSVDSSLNQAMNSIEDRAARADAEATLNEDPDEKILRESEKQSRQADISDLLAGFQPKAEAEAAG